MHLSALSRVHYYLAVVTLLDQLDPKECNWQRLSVILQGRLPNLPPALDGMKLNMEFSQIVSKFLLDQERAGFFWVNSQKYTDLARHILEFLYDK